MISVNRKDTNEEYGCIEHLKKNETATMFFLEKSFSSFVCCIFFHCFCMLCINLDSNSKINTYSSMWV